MTLPLAGDSPNLSVSHHLEVIRADWQLTFPAEVAPNICPPYVASPNFTPWYGEACMEFTSCPRMLHGQPTGGTEIQTCDLHIHSPFLSIQPPCLHETLPEYHQL